MSVTDSGSVISSQGLVSVEKVIFLHECAGSYCIHYSAACVSVCLSVVNAILARVMRAVYGIRQTAASVLHEKIFSQRMLFVCL